MDKMEKFQLENSCSICLGGLNQEPTVDLECHHRFHIRCIKSWEDTARRQRIQATCPNCRKRIRYKSQSHQQSHQRSIGSLNFLQVFPAQNQVLDQQIRLRESSSQSSNFCSQKCGIIIFAIVALGLQALIFFMYISSCISLFADPNVPIFSAGMDAKGYIAIGMYAKGVVAVGMVAQGIFTLSMVGVGLLLFVGQVGGGLGFGIYQIGIAWYCYIGQLSIGVWATRKAQMGFSIIAPLFNPSRKHLVDCDS